VLKPHEHETPAGGDKTQLKAYPTCFYRTPFAWQVADVVEALSRARPGGQGLRLIGIGDAGLATLFGRAIASANVRIGKTIVDLSSITPEEAYHPSMLRIGGWRAAAMQADPGILVLYGKAIDAGPVRAAYKAAGREGALVITEESILEILR
jgi:hypothetical protein